VPSSDSAQTADPAALFTLRAVPVPFVATPKMPFGEVGSGFVSNVNALTSPNCEPTAISLPSSPPDSGVSDPDAAFADPGV
jgi:hypothetical protein